MAYLHKINFYIEIFSATLFEANSTTGDTFAQGCPFLRAMESAHGFDEEIEFAGAVYKQVDWMHLVKRYGAVLEALWSCQFQTHRMWIVQNLLM